MNMIKTLTARFGDEALSTMIETAKRSSKTSAMAEKLQAKQLANWAALKKNPDDIFALLHLNSAKSLLFDQPSVNSWLKYMDDFTLKSSSVEFSAISTLRKYYNDETLAEMIIVALKSSKTSEAAKRVETELLRTWLNSMKSSTDVRRLLNLSTAPQSELSLIWRNYVALLNKVDPKFKTEMLQAWVKKGLITDDTFRLLTLGNAADDLLNGSLLSAWATYIKVFNQQNPTEQLNLIAVLTARFGDEAVSTMLEAAKKVPTYHTIANRVQTEQMKLWLDAGKLPDHIFVALKLNTVKTKLFDQPQLNTWVVYLDEFNKANPNSKTTLTGTKVFESPLYNVWTNYVGFMKKAGAFRGDTITLLRGIYGDESLAKVLIAAGKVQSTKNVANTLEKELFALWKAARVHPTQIHKLLRVENVSRNSPIYKFYGDYVLAYTRA
eukprot:jgi/Phyca11/18692/fgenesh1_pg.PHYCAscaffold_39_\